MKKTIIFVLSCGANLSNETVFVPIFLESDQTVQLEVFDMSGRRLYFSNIQMQKGWRQLELPKAVLTQSTQFLRISAGQVTKTERIIRTP